MNFEKETVAAVFEANPRHSTLYGTADGKLFTDETYALLHIRAAKLKDKKVQLLHREPIDVETPAGESEEEDK